VSDAHHKGTTAGFDILYGRPDDPRKGQDKVFRAGPGRYFVFGSNMAGIHGAGAAKAALDQYGAVWGQGEGFQGRCYAIPTKDTGLNTLPIDAIRWYVETFLIAAGKHQDLYFFVTRIGCGLAGYNDDQIGPLFRKATPNVELPYGWG
jgi:hypothetical protein